MYNYNQVLNGITKFLDTEIIIKLPGIKRWVVGAASGIMLSRGLSLFNELKKNDIVKSLEIIDANDNINVDILYTELKKQADKSAATFEIPMIGAITLTSADVDKLYEFIKA